MDLPIDGLWEKEMFACKFIRGEELSNLFLLVLKFGSHFFSFFFSFSLTYFSFFALNFFILFLFF